MPTRVVTSRDSQPVSVNALLQNPLVLPERILSFVENQFIAEKVLRSVGQVTGGAVQYRVSSGQFADNASEVVSEGAEIPLATVSRGDIESAPVNKRALGVAITREMRLRNALGEVERQLTVVKNTLVRDFDSAFFSALTGAVTLSHAATASWDQSGATIRKDINAARLLVQQQVTPGASSGDFLGFDPDTLIIPRSSQADLLNSTEFLQMIKGQVQPSNVGSLAEVGSVLNLNVLVSPTLADGTAYVLESKTVGGYADEIPLEATELYYVQQNQLYRSDVTRSSAVFVDQPLAVAEITGI